MSKNPTNEYLLNNYIQKEFQSYLLPLNFVQSIFWISKYTIRYNFITPNSLGYYIISFACLCSVVGIHFYEYENVIIDGVTKTKVLQQSIFINTFIYIILFFVTFFLNWSHVNDNITIVLKIQDVYTTLKSHKKIRIFQSLLIWNWLYIIIVMSCYVITITLHFLFIHFNLQPTAVIIAFSHIYFDISEVYGIRIMKLILVEMQLWISELEKLAQTKIGYGNTESHCNEMLKSYKNILGTFENFKKTLQFVLLLKTTVFFIHALVYIQIIMEIISLEAENATLYLGLISKVTLCVNGLKDLGLLGHMCVECEMFYMHINHASSVASAILNKETCPDALKQLCKNVMRLNNLFERMTACFFFTVDAALPIRLLAVVTTYAVVLLQFNHFQGKYIVHY